MTRNVKWITSRAFTGILATLLFNMVACSTSSSILRPTLSNQRKAIIDAARHFEQLKKSSYFSVNNTYYHYDCSGFVMATWDLGGIQLLKNMNYEKSQSGVIAIHDHLKSKGKLFIDPKRVLPGDLVFFHNTYDRNKNKKNDDLLTHIGLVISKSNDGTMIFLNRTSRGITEDRLNLTYPHIHKNVNNTVNTFLRKKKFRDPNGTKYLTSELFAVFGTF